MTMSSRERVEAALHHRTPDRTPIFEYVLLSPLADQLLGRTYAADYGAHWDALVGELGWEAAVRRAAQDQLELALRLGHDMLYVIPNPAPAQAEGFLPGERAGVAAASDPVERLRLRNQAEASQPAAPADERLLVYAFLEEEMKARGVDLPVLAPTYEHGIWTDVDLMQAMLLAPEVAHEHFRLATCRALGAVTKYLQLGIDQMGVGGDFAGNVLLISPPAYRTFIVPEVREVARRIHAAGKWAITASDGNLWPVIEDVLFACEADGYLEIDMHAGMDLRRLKAAYGGRVTFYGNLDPGNTLSFATPAEVERHTLDCIEAGLGNGGHILCASNAITSSVPLANYMAVQRAYRRFFGMGELIL